jgi:hypothetical protein
MLALNVNYLFSKIGAGVGDAGCASKFLPGARSAALYKICCAMHSYVNKSIPRSKS